MNIRLAPINDENRDAVLALSVREDLYVCHKTGFRETGVISGGEAVLKRMLKGSNRLVKDFSASTWMNLCA